jgi:hypothetical protein
VSLPKDSGSRFSRDAAVAHGTSPKVWRFAVSVLTKLPSIISSLELFAVVCWNSFDSFRFMFEGFEWNGHTNGGAFDSPLVLYLAVEQKEILPNRMKRSKFNHSTAFVLVCCHQLVDAF